MIDKAIEELEESHRLYTQKGESMLPRYKLCEGRLMSLLDVAEISKKQQLAIWGGIMANCK